MGIYGGFGSKPSQETWQPAVTSGLTEADKRPQKKHRGLRLRRRPWRPRPEDEGVMVLAGSIAIAAFLACWILFLVIFR
jgi:hypothetical protein